jgi:LysM repeat protein
VRYEHPERAVRLPADRPQGRPPRRDDPPSHDYYYYYDYNQSTRHAAAVRRDTYRGLREPERSEMIDFSGVFPAITRQFLAVNDSDLPESIEAHRPMRFGHTSTVSGPGRLEHRRHHSAPLQRRHLHQSYQASEPMTGPTWMAEMPDFWSRPVPPEQYARRYLGGLIGWVRTAKLGRLIPAWMLINLAILVCVTLILVSQGVPTAIHQAADSCQWYTVTGNDTIYSISAAHHLDAQSVASANHLKSFGDIHPGQRLCIPAGLGRLIPEAQDGLQTPRLIASGPAIQGETKFIQFALPFAQSAHQQTGWPVSMILAQWGLEHGWLVPGFTGYNWGNVGALPGVPEVASGGAWGAPAYFAYAPTPQDGVNYYVSVAHLSFYQGVGYAARHGGPNAAAKALGTSPWDAGHYTGIGDPGSSLIIVMHAFNLYHYDK